MSKAPSGFGDVPNPFGEPDAAVEEYQPPAIPSWQRQQQSTIPIEDEADDEPFTAAHLAAATQSSVPAVTSIPQSSPAPRPPLPSTTNARVLPFTTSVASPQHDIKGTIGPASPTAVTNQPRQQQPPPQVHRYGSTPDTNLLLNNAGSSSAPVSTAPVDEDPSTYAFYNIKRYRTYFNVDTDQVLQRVFRAVALFFKGDFFDHIGGNPDLYGPWWIASTLVFVSAAAGNTANYIAYRRYHPSGSAPPSPGGEASAMTGWYYDIDKVGGSMGLFYGYIGVIGLLVYGVLRWFQAGVSLAQVWCAYGYAMGVYIPMAALCVLPMEAVRWSLVMTATATSGLFLALNFRVPIVNAAGAKAVPVLLLVLGAHAVLGLSLKLYFFHYSDTSTAL